MLLRNARVEVEVTRIGRPGIIRTLSWKSSKCGGGGVASVSGLLGNVHGI